MTFRGSVTPVNREADVPEAFSVDVHRRQPVGHHGRPFDRAAGRGDFDFRSVRDPFLFGQRLGDLDEESRLQLVEHAGRLMLRPVVEVLGQAVRRADDREFVDGAKSVLVGFERQRHWIRRDVRMQRILDRRFNRFVVLGERSVLERRGVETTNALRQHDECAVGSGRGIGFHIGNVAHPLRAIPLDAGARRIPWLPVRICAGAVVHDAAIRRPRKCPAVEHAEPGRIGIVAALRVVARLAVHAGMEPVAAQRRAVVLQLSESVELLTSGLEDLGRIFRIFDVGKRLAIHLLQHFAEIGVDRIGVRPDDIENGFCSGAPFFAIEALHGEEDARDDFLIHLCQTGRIECLPLPLHPARGVSERAVFLRKIRRGQQEHFGLNLRSRRAAIHLRRVPESRRLGHHIFHHHHPLQLREGGDHLLRVRPETDRIHAERDEALRSGLFSADAHRRSAIHVVEDVHPRVIAIDLREPAVAPVVVFG